MDLYTPPSVAYGGAYAIRPYDRVCAILQNTDAIPQLGTCCPSKNYPVFVSFGAVEWGVFDTPLRLGTCDPSKYRCNSPTGYVLPFKKLSRFRPLRGRGVGVFNTPLRLGTCGPSKNDSVFVPFGAVCGAYSIRPYDWVRAALQKMILFSSPSGPSVRRMQYTPTAGYMRSFEIPMQFSNWVCTILRNTDAIPQLGTCEGSKNGSVYATVGGVWWGVYDTSLQPGMCGPSKYRCDPPTGYA